MEAESSYFKAEPIKQTAQQKRNRIPLETLRILTAVIIFPAIFVFIIHGYFITFFTRDAKTRQKKLNAHTSSYSRFAMRVLRIQIKLSSSIPTFETENFLIVSNHLSYIDMIAIAAIQPSCFVTSVDLGMVPFLGTIARICGSLFVERRNKERLTQDRTQIEEALVSGLQVVLFPEGTSGNGETVLPFKRGLLMTASLAGRRILPVTIHYSHLNGEPLRPRDRDQVCWYGDMSFLPHFWNILALRSVSIDVHFHRPCRFEKDVSKETVAESLHQIISQKYLSRSN